MLVYFLVNLSIIVLGTIVSQALLKLFVDKGIKPMSSLGFKRDETGRIKDPSNNRIFFILTGLILLFVTVFRAPTNGLSVDYPTYLKYSEIFSTLGIRGSLSDAQSMGIEMEGGFVYLMSLLAPVDPLTILPLIFITTLVMILGYFKVFRKYSPIVWLSVLAFVAFGSYYAVFNTIAQSMAIGLVFGAAGYLYERGARRFGFIKYALIILVVSLVHKSVLILIPFYFILTHRFSLKKMSDQILLILTAIFFIFAFAFPGIIIDLGINTLFGEYKEYSGSGNVLEVGSSIQVVVRSIILICIIYCLRKNVDMKDMRDVVGVNAVVIFSLINILSLQIILMQRLSYLFVPFMTIFIATVVSRIEDKRNRRAWIALICTIFVLYSVASTMALGDGKFNFIWQE